MKSGKKRLALVGVILLGVGAAAALAFTAFRQNMLYFFSPTQVSAGEAPIGHTFRLGGLVETGSVVKAGTRRFSWFDRCEGVDGTQRSSRRSFSFRCSVRTSFSS